MIESIWELLLSVASGVTADAIVTYASSAWKVAEAAAAAAAAGAAALLVWIVTAARKNGQNLWGETKKMIASMTYYRKGATSLWLTKATLIWYASLVAVTVHYDYIARTEIPGHLEAALLAGVCYLIGHSICTLVRWSRSRQTP